MESLKTKQVFYVNGYLLNINVIASEIYSCSIATEIVYYFLFYWYPLWIKFRTGIWDLGYKYNR